MAFRPFAFSLFTSGSKKTIEGYATNLIEDVSEEWLNKRDTSKPFCLVIGDAVNIGCLYQAASISTYGMVGMVI